MAGPFVFVGTASWLLHNVFHTWGPPGLGGAHKDWGPWPRGLGFEPHCCLATPAELQPARPRQRVFHSHILVWTLQHFATGMKSNSWVRIKIKCYWFESNIYLNIIKFFSLWFQPIKVFKMSKLDTKITIQKKRSTSYERLPYLI